MKSIAFHHWWIGGVHVESAFPQGIERKLIRSSLFMVDAMEAGFSRTI
jgi:hypothetical protein